MNRARAIWSPIWNPIWNRCLRLFGRFRPTEQDGHPTPELLAAYHEDRLSPEKDGEIQEHFVECPECPELVLSLDEFASKEMPILVSDDLSDTRVDRAWRRLRRQLLTDITVPRIPRPRLLWLRRPALAWGLVGLLLPSTVGLGVRVQSLHGELQLENEPELNAAFATVFPELTKRGSAEPREVRVPRDVKVVLAFDPPVEDATFADYRLEIQRPGGTDVWKRAGLRKNAEGWFSVGLPRHFLEEGEYTIRVVGIVHGRERVVQDYPVRLSYL
jgi:hypothetical protein